MFVYMYKHVCSYVYMCICVYVYMCMCVYIYIYICNIVLSETDVFNSGFIVDA